MDFLAIAGQLNEEGSRLATLQLAKFDAERALSEAEFAVLAELDPAALGKNEKERAINTARALRQDPAWCEAEAALTEARRGLIVAEAQYRALANTRRGMEYTARLLAGGESDD